MSSTLDTPTGRRPGAQPLWFIHNLAYIHVDGDQAGGEFDLGEVWGAHGDMPPLHVHHRDDETFYVLEGQLTMFVGDRQIVLEAGEAAVAPHGIPHVYRVDSEVAHWLVIGRPAGFADFVRALGAPAAAAQLPPADLPVDAERIAALAAEHGIEILGPPGMLPSELVDG